jgi:VWFA-related protein
MIDKGYAMRNCFRSLLIAFSAASVLAAANSQSPVPAAPPAPSTPLAGAGTSTPVDPHRIDIDVQVTDKLGHHIGGLQAQDFTLLDNKQPAKILNFREVDSRNQAKNPLHVVIVVDAINGGLQLVAREREQLGEFLKQDGGRLGHATALAVLTEKDIQIEKGFSTDGNALLASLNGYTAPMRFEGRSAGFYGAADRLQWSLKELGQLAAYEAAVPGRKLAFFISPGWPLFPRAGIDETSKQRDWTFNSIVALSNGLREAHVALYAIDPEEIGRTNPFFYQGYLKPVTKANNAEYADLSLQVLSTHTGGLVQVTGMDIKGEIETAIRDADAYYALAFEPAPADAPNEYHDLHLQVNKPGATVRTTSGYYANVRP